VQRSKERARHQPTFLALRQSTFGPVLQTGWPKKRISDNPQKMGTVCQLLAQCQDFVIMQILLLGMRVEEANESPTIAKYVVYV
jgi:hypothetical protein